MLDRAQRRSWQFFGENNFARRFEAGEPRLNIRRQRFRVNLSPRPPEHIGDRHFIPARIGPTDDGAFGDSGVLHKHAFDFRRIDVLSSGNDQVLLAIMDPKMSIGIAEADIASVIPAVAQRLARCLRQYSEKTLGPRTAISPGVPGGNFSPASLMIAALQHRSGKPADASNNPVRLLALGGFALDIFAAHIAGEQGPCGTSIMRCCLAPSMGVTFRIPWTELLLRAGREARTWRYRARQVLACWSIVSAGSSLVERHHSFPPIIADEARPCQGLGTRVQFLTMS